MMKTVSEIIEAQNFLKNQYGEEGYARLIEKAKQKKTQTLIGMANDDSREPTIRLVAIAALGE